MSIYYVPGSMLGMGGTAENEIKISALAKMIFEQREPAISHQRIKRLVNRVSCHEAHKLGRDTKNNRGQGHFMRTTGAEA